MPSGVLNANWFASNLVRKYPIDSNASCIDDKGNYLPDDIIVDIHVSYPDTIGTTCYISAVNITDNLISIVVSVDDVSIAAICIPRPSSMYRYYTMDPLVNGVVALIAIGLDSISTTGHWVFSNKNNSKILPRCCNAYPGISVLSLSRPSDSSPLTGDILLTAGNDLMFTVDKARVDKLSRNVVFLGLNTNTTDADTILRRYITKCQISTEMDTCKRKTITGIATAIPDCSGNINIISDDINIGNYGDGIITFTSDKKLPDICENEPQQPPGDAPRPWNECPFESEQAPNVYHPCPKEEQEKEEEIPNVVDGFNLYNSDLVQVLAGGAEYGYEPGLTNVVESGDLALAIKIGTDKPATWYFRVLDSNYNKLLLDDLLYVGNNYVTFNGSTVGYSGQLNTLKLFISSTRAKLYINSTDSNATPIVATYNNWPYNNGVSHVLLNSIRLEKINFES